MGNATDIGRVFKIVYTNFHIVREGRFVELTCRFLAKNLAQNFLGYLGEIESDYRTV